MGKASAFAFCAGLALISTVTWRRTGLSTTTSPSSTQHGDAAPSPRQLRREALALPFFKSKDPKTVKAKKDGNRRQKISPLSICGREAPINPQAEMQMKRKYSDCPLLDRPPSETSVLLIDGVETFGRTGNNLIEFLHALQYGRDNDMLVAISLGSWATHLITGMWMAVAEDTDEARAEWARLVERDFCVRILESREAADAYANVLEMDTRDLFLYKHYGNLNQYVEYQGQVIRSLYRRYNDGTGVNMRRKPVQDMCSVLDVMFGPDPGGASYSVVHSRSLEGEPGLRLLARIARNVGCDPTAALDMEPEYVKAILGPLGMLDKPILFITDHQRPEILEKLLGDPDVGPNIRLIPPMASWVGGDITAAVMSDVFIGNPASSFSGFIAKSRVALGFKTNFLFRKKTEKGEWVDVCDERGIFDQNIMNAMA